MRSRKTKLRFLTNWPRRASRMATAIISVLGEAEVLDVGCVALACPDADRRPAPPRARGWPSQPAHSSSRALAGPGLHEADRERRCRRPCETLRKGVQLAIEQIAASASAIVAVADAARELLRGEVLGALDDVVERETPTKPYSRTGASSPRLARWRWERTPPARRGRCTVGGLAGAVSGICMRRFQRASSGPGACAGTACSAGFLISATRV